MRLDEKVGGPLGKDPSRSEQGLNLLALDVYLHEVRHEPVGSESHIVERDLAIAGIGYGGHERVLHLDRTMKPGIRSHAPADAQTALLVALERQHPAARELGQDQGVVAVLATDVKRVGPWRTQKTKVTIELDLVESQKRACLVTKVNFDTQASANADRKPPEFRSLRENGLQPRDHRFRP